MEGGEPESMEESSLKTVLAECRISAKRGYQIASSQEKFLSKTLNNAKSRVHDTLNKFNNSSVYSPESTGLLEQQLLDIEHSFNSLSLSVNETIEDLHTNNTAFSIALFGRTMAGKSTLMEILTHGDGSTIGKGAQRTTLEKREYMWNGLSITDLPGIGAFSGGDDEQIAFEAARKADMVLFLITDDGPQAVDADFFSRIVSIGKPIICILNVKVSIPKGANLKLIKNDIQRSFNIERLDAIKNQFLQYSELYGQSWRHIPFIYVHLMAAFEAQQTDDLERANVYCHLSRIDYLKKLIADQVRLKGNFLRIKTFTDSISVPMLESLEHLLDQSRLNSVQGRVIVEKRKHLSEWKDVFYRDGKKRISSLVTSLRSGLNSEIPGFVEDHFEDKDVNEEWNNLLNDRRVEIRCQELLQELEMSVNDKLKETSREITSELKFMTSFEGGKGFSIKQIRDWEKVWKQSSAIVGGSLAIAAEIASTIGAAIAGPLSLAALLVFGIGFLGSSFSKKRTQKENEAKAILEEALRDSAAKMCASLEKQMNKHLDLLVESRINRTLRELDKLNNVIFSLSDTQRDLAWDLNNHLLQLNKQTVTEAIAFIAPEDTNIVNQMILSVARVPGNCNRIMLKDGAVFPLERQTLEKIMSERVRFVFPARSTRVLISRILGIDVKNISIEKKIGVARVPLDGSGPEMITSVRLAEQLSKTHIIGQ